MRMGIKIGLAIGGFVIITGSIIGYGVWHTKQKPKQVAVVKSEVTTDPASNSLNVTAESGLGGGLDGGTSQQQKQSSSESKVPGPETFSQFDKYKNDKAALFQDIQPGTGDEIKPNKNAAVLYKVYLTDGKLVDQNKVDKDSKIVPFVFGYGAHQVIAGWEQGVGGMKVGGVRRVIIPPAVGYGAQGKAPVPPNAVLVIDIQLLEVQK
jgi:FKBP-type peptidyl-prolyl cis-trans isomerase FkpA